MKTLLFILALILIPISVQAQFANDGINGFNQHLANYKADMAAAAVENAYIQNDLNDNSQEAQDLVNANPDLSQQISDAADQLSPVGANPVLGIKQTMNVAQ